MTENGSYGKVIVCNVVKDAVGSVVEAMSARHGVVRGDNSNGRMGYTILRGDDGIECTLRVDGDRIYQGFSAEGVPLQEIARRRLIIIRSDSIFGDTGLLKRSQCDLPVWQRAVVREESDDGLELQFLVQRGYVDANDDPNIPSREDELDIALRRYVVFPSLLLSKVYDPNFP